MIHQGRVIARMEGEFAVFLIGMRLNKPLLVHQWLPIVRAMPRMLRELYESPELGMLSHEMWLSRTVLVLQYWRSLEHLLDYANSRDCAHLPEWRRFNRAIGASGDVGIWHETYTCKPGSYMNVYVNMPEFGLGKAGALVAPRSRALGPTGAD